MKIGILTLPLHSNYGGILQAYALQKYLKGRGHEAILLNRKFNKTGNAFIRKVFGITLYRKKVKEKELITQNINYFIDSYISPITKELHSTKDLKKKVSELGLDVLLVGSDQVWRYKYISKMLPDYFMGINTNSSIEIISYAASFGSDSWEGDNESILSVKKMLRNFDAISVREDTGKKICKNLFNVDAEQHIDPVLLLDTCDYLRLVQKENEPARNEELLIYMLDIDGDKQKVINMVQDNVGGKTFSINKPDIKDVAPLRERIYPTVTSWLKGFFDAKFVITDSFHGTIFSLMHNKPFIVYGNKKRGLTRFYSILKKVNLSHRIIRSSEDLTKEILNENIDWLPVNRFLNSEREKADKYFQDVNL